LRGTATALAEDDEDAWIPCASSCIDIVFQCDEWAEGWLGAETRDALRQLEAAVAGPHAWRPAWQPLDALADVDPLSPGTCETDGGFEARRHEFCPPVCAEQTVALVALLMRRCAWICAPPHRQLYIDAAPRAVVAGLHAKLAGVVTKAEQFKDMLGEGWLPGVGAAICAAHFLEHALTEPQGPLLAAEVAGLGRADVGLFAREAAKLAGMKRKWGYKLAKVGVDRFQALFAAYR
jgi:hypothetical protein